jgi:predicted dehydrogenase
MIWGLIGCGVIGERRITNLPDGVTLTACFDPNTSRAQVIQQKTNCKIANSVEDLLNNHQVQAVVIASVNSVLTEIIQKCLDKGVHVLVEKPAARNFKELERLKNPKNCVVKIGFNHRFHPAFNDLVASLQKHSDDPVMFVRAQYGNGARLGFEKEWRAKPEIAGGGELLDQGVHVIDLASVVMKDLEVVTGYARTQYWNMPVDDNTWAILRGSGGSTFTFHVSSSEWKNEFRFEVYTRSRKYQWLGLGRSYGTEKLITHTMKAEMGPPETQEKSYPPEDNSWKDENTNFLHAIQNKAQVYGGLKDAIQCLKLVDRIYETSQQLQKNLPGQPTHPQWWRE